MRTKVWKLAALLLVVLLALSGCSLIEIDEEMDAAEAVAIVNGETITKAEVQDTYSYQLSYYQMYGADTSTLKDTVLDGFIEDRLLTQKAKELDLDTLTAEETAEAEESANAKFEELIEYYKAEAATEDMTEEEARQATIEYLAGYDATLESYIELAIKERAHEKVRESIVGDVTVTDEEVQTKYDEMVAADQLSYAADGASFESAVTNGTTVAWMPEGYRTVKHILLALTDEQSQALSALEDELSAVETSIAALEAAAATPAPDATATPAPEATQAPDPSAAVVPMATPAPTLEELNAQKAGIEARIVDYKKLVAESFQPKIDEINAKLAEGATFTDLIAEYGEDPGMQSEPTMTAGYYVSANSTTWESTFKDTAMALSKVGDISQPVLGSYGMHIIRYESDVTPGAVPFETLGETIRSTTLEEKQDEVYDAKIAEWLAAADVKKYPDRLE